jgi:hypothetical protein
MFLLFIDFVFMISKLVETDLINSCISQLQFKEQKGGTRTLDD